MAGDIVTATPKTAVAMIAVIVFFIVFAFRFLDLQKLDRDPLTQFNLLWGNDTDCYIFIFDTPILEGFDVRVTSADCDNT